MCRDGGWPVSGQAHVMAVRARQLELHSPGADGWGVDPPWRGQSPRVLTRAFGAFSFTAEGMGRLDLDASHVGDQESTSSSIQLELFPLVRGCHG